MKDFIYYNNKNHIKNIYNILYIIKMLLVNNNIGPSKDSKKLLKLSKNRKDTIKIKAKPYEKITFKMG